jgi:hypothetical protein
MTDRLTTDQIAWLVNRSPGFARSYADVLRRDADVEENRLKMLVCTEIRTEVTAATGWRAPKLRLAERLQRPNRIGTQP